MHCPFCRHTDSRVVDSRVTDDGSSIRRRRQCPDCGRRFTTVETASLAVVKRSGVTEPFSRAKVLVGVRKACQGRPVGEDDLALLAQRVEEAVRASGAAEVDAHEVGLAILGPLREARRDRLPALRVRLPGVRVARGLRGRHHAAARRARRDRGRTGTRPPRRRPQHP
nr:ATP cone domain-containing protein [Angustibacter aerolatus]